MRRKTLNKDRKGATAIEFALIVPLFLLLVFGVIEFGAYFMQKLIADRAVSTMSDAIQKNAGDEVLLTDIAYSSGMKLMNLNPLSHPGGVANTNYICAQSYPTRQLAEAGLCTGATWKTSPPPGVIASYYVAIRVFASKKLALPFSDYFPDIRSEAVILVTPYPIPPGAVMAFDTCPPGTAVDSCPCPTGWSPFIPANGRNIIGLGSSGTLGATNHTAREALGEEKHVQSLSELARHHHDMTHTLETSTEGRSNTPDGDVEFDRGYNDITVKDSGDSAPMPIMDPYLALQYCKKDKLPGT